MLHQFRFQLLLRQATALGLRCERRLLNETHESLLDCVYFNDVLVGRLHCVNHDLSEDLSAFDLVVVAQRSQALSWIQLLQFVQFTPQFVDFATEHGNARVHILVQILDVGLDRQDRVLLLQHRRSEVGGRACVARVPAA